MILLFNGDSARAWRANKTGTSLSLPLQAQITLHFKVHKVLVERAAVHGPKPFNAILFWIAEFGETSFRADCVVNLFFKQVPHLGPKCFSS